MWSFKLEAERNGLGPGMTSGPSLSQPALFCHVPVNWWWSLLLNSQGSQGQVLAHSAGCLVAKTSDMEESFAL